MKLDKNLAIGVFDSGVGGISTLSQLIYNLPNEKYIYYGDSKNAPYGLKDPKIVEKLSLDVGKKLIEKGVKSIVIACNTATSSAMDAFKRNFDIPIIGMEPAIKKAVELNKKGRIMVMATPVTLEGERFNRELNSLNPVPDIIKLPCRGLVEIIEEYGGGIEVENYLKKAFKDINVDEIGLIVLGCTHFIFIRDEIRRVLGKDIDMIDANKYTAMELKEILIEKNLMNPNTNDITEVTIINSSNDNKMMKLSKNLLEKELNKLEWKGNIKYI